jgi:2'-5' RNA ligase
MRRTVRTFVAVEVSPEVMARSAELIKKLTALDAPVRWVDPQKMHFTLKFLGEVESLEIPDVCTVVDEAVKELPPFECQVAGAGAFPDLHRPRTVWLGMKYGIEAMIALHDAIDAGLTELGFRTEQRRYRPHLTLGRVRGGRPDDIARLARGLEEYRDYVGGVTDVSEVVVFSSSPQRDGPIYEPLSHASLEGR